MFVKMHLGVDPEQSSGSASKAKLTQPAVTPRISIEIFVGE